MSRRRPIWRTRNFRSSVIPWAVSSTTTRRRRRSRAGAGPRWSSANCGPRPVRRGCSGVHVRRPMAASAAISATKSVFDRGGGRTRRRGLRRGAAQRHRRALHRDLRHRGAEAALAAEAGARRAGRRDRDDASPAPARTCRRSARPRIARRQHYVINGAKTFITNGQTADLVIVVAKTDPTQGAKGISLIVVETDEAEGFARGRKLEKIGLEAQDTSELFFDDVQGAGRQPARRRGGQGLLPADGELPQERLIIALGSAVAMIERALEADDRLRQGAQGVRQADHRLPEHASSSSPNARPRRRSRASSSTTASSGSSPASSTRRRRRWRSTGSPSRSARSSTSACSSTAATAT